MITATQAEFARMLGYSQAAITKFKKSDRLVFTDDGLVDVEASKQRLKDTSDPNRDDVARRHAENRGTEIETDDVDLSFQEHRANREKYLALQEKASYEKSIGLLVERAVVERGLDGVSKIIRASFEKLPDILSAELAVESDPNRIHAILVENIEYILSQANEMIKELDRELDNYL